MNTAATDQHTHILPLRVYLGVGSALLVLTAITVGVSFLHFGGWNLVVALLIASIKASLVALFFMHLKYDNKLYFFIFAFALLFLTILIVFTMFDTLERDRVYREKSSPINKSAIIYDTTAAPQSADSLESTPDH